MEEKNATKISLSTFFLLLAIIAIIVMGLFIYKLNIDKNIEIQKSNELQSQISSLNETVNDLQGKINNISENNVAENTSKTDNSKDSNETNQNTNNDKILYSNEQVKKALSDYLELRSYANVSAILERLTEKGELNYNHSKDKLINNNTTILTNVKFSEYKKAMLNYVSEKEFERNWASTRLLKEGDDGYLTKPEGGGGLRTYTIKSINQKSDLTYEAKTNYIIDDNKKDSGSEDFTFTIESYNGKCVIDSISSKND